MVGYWTIQGRVTNGVAHRPFLEENNGPLSKPVPNRSFFLPILQEGKH